MPSNEDLRRERKRQAPRGFYMNYYEDMGFASTEDYHNNWLKAQKEFQDQLNNRNSELNEWGGKIDAAQSELQTARDSIPTVHDFYKGTIEKEYFNQVMAARNRKAQVYEGDQSELPQEYQNLDVPVYYSVKHNTMSSGDSDREVKDIVRYWTVAEGEKPDWTNEQKLNWAYDMIQAQKGGREFSERAEKAARPQIMSALEEAYGTLDQQQAELNTAKDKYAELVADRDRTVAESETYKADQARAYLQKLENMRKTIGGASIERR